MSRWLPLAVVSLLLCFVPSRTAAQIEEAPHSGKDPGQNQAPPRYDRDAQAEESSSRDTKIDLSPSKDDTKDHPLSDATDSDSGDVSTQELRPWDPHKAAKDVEVGDFYFKRKNYLAAIARYQDALLWKDNDAMANFRLGQVYEKVGDSEQASAHYQTYLTILPHGPDAVEAQRALENLKNKADSTSAKKQVGEKSVQQ